MLKQGNNHGTNSYPSEDTRAVEQAFLRLGNVLAEIANDIERRKANISQDTEKNKDKPASTRQDAGDGEMNNGNHTDVPNQ